MRRRQWTSITAGPVSVDAIDLDSAEAVEAHIAAAGRCPAGVRRGVPMTQDLDEREAHERRTQKARSTKFEIPTCPKLPGDGRPRRPVLALARPDRHPS